MSVHSMGVGMDGARLFEVTSIWNAYIADEGFVIN